MIVLLSTDSLITFLFPQPAFLPLLARFFRAQTPHNFFAR